MKQVLILGDDPRFDRVANALRQEGYELSRTADSAAGASLVLCPPAWREDLLLPLAKEMARGAVLATFQSGLTLEEACRERGVRLFPLLQEKSYLQENARATAEGTLAEAVRLLPRVLQGETVLICGYGNCGRALAQVFRAIGCRVLIWSHPKSLQKALVDGYESVSTALLPSVSLTVNTVPQPDFLPDFLPRLAPGSFFFQIATGLTGIDPGALAKRGVSFHALPGLPGKTAPESEAEAILTLIRERL